MAPTYHISTMDFLRKGKAGRVLFKELSCSKWHIRLEARGSLIDDVSK